MALVDSVRAARLPSPALRREIRLNAGVSLAEIGAELGVTGVAVLRWERGTATPRRDRAIAYNALLEKLREASS